MIRFVLSVYDSFRRHRALAWSLTGAITVCLVLAILTLSYKEDIFDFLPLDEKNQTALSVYQDISGANNVYAIISLRDTSLVDPDLLTEGVEAFAGHLAEADTAGYVSNVTKEIDMDKMLGIAEFAYANAPYFMTDGDYARADSLLADPGFVNRQLAADKEMLLFPSSAMMAANMGRDPLNLFSPVLARLNRGGMPIDFETYDGYILSPDSKRAIVVMESAFGSSESEHNAALAAMLGDVKGATEKELPELDIHVIGGPLIAVANAERIKKDSILAVAIAGVLIVLLLIYVFRNARNILLIVVSVAWGWLFAMGGIALYYDSVSIIVIGIASVILGIAINYPLHLIDHIRESEHPRAALREIVSPLVVGNVTTVGAFLCLVPLDSPALHDLGLFSSLLLVGTILFVLVVLPHLVRTRRPGDPKVSDPKLITRLAGISVENSRWLVWAVLLLTVVFGYFSLRTEFDSDMRNINYMTPEQRENMAWFQSLVDSTSDAESLYVVSNGSDWNEALRCNESITARIDSIVKSGKASRRGEVSAFLVSDGKQQERLERWKRFVNDHHEALTTGIARAAANQGFGPEAFAPFGELVTADLQPKSFSDFEEFSGTVFSNSLSENPGAGRKSVVQELSVRRADMEEVKEALGREREFGGLFFDVRSMNGAIANTLSDDFNYIGVACGFIVFIFLWISLGSIELAIVSFMPMAFSWIWILGIMGMLGIKFNIVNVILATFIFGQGDDYTIFMTEGLSYEFAYRRKILASYKNSIIVSALIMFIGIGTLLFAKHPALRSLGEVTVVGMLSVVIMAYLFPPLVFRWLTRTKSGELRRHPVTLRGLLRRLSRTRLTPDQELREAVYGRYIYKGREVEVTARRMLREIARNHGECDSMCDGDGPISISDTRGQGEIALLVALKQPGRPVYCYLPEGERRELLRGCAEDFTPNLHVINRREDLPSH